MARKRRPSELAGLVLAYLSKTDSYSRRAFVETVRRFGAAIEFKDGASMENVAAYNQAWTAATVEREIRAFMNRYGR